MDLFIPSDKVTDCAYKDKANYYSAKICNKSARDIAWYYMYPGIEALKIRGRIAFFQEHVDALYVDGVEQSKPKTLW